MNSQNTPEQVYPTENQFYQVRLKGYLDPGWSEWFDGFSIRHEGNGVTVLNGLIQDQAVLFGLFSKLQNLGLTLLSVNSCSQDE